MPIAIEQLTAQELVKEWESELESLKTMETSNPKWEWKPVQMHLERLHALAHELQTKMARERAKWQP